MYYRTRVHFAPTGLLMDYGYFLYRHFVPTGTFYFMLKLQSGIPAFHYPVRDKMSVTKEREEDSQSPVGTICIIGQGVHFAPTELLMDCRFFLYRHFVPIGTFYFMLKLQSGFPAFHYPVRDKMSVTKEDEPDS